MPGAEAAKQPSVSFYKAADLRKHLLLYRKNQYLRLSSNGGKTHENIGTTATLTPAKFTSTNYNVLTR